MLFVCKLVSEVRECVFLFFLCVFVCEILCV